MPVVPDLPLVYLAGPYTHPDPVKNTHTTIKAATRLYETGLVVPHIPHLTLLWDMVDPRPHSFWCDYDLHLLQRCDCVLRLDGHSPGSAREINEADRLGLPVFSSEGSLLEWAKSWRVGSKP